jgi:hypothetical protein
VNLVGKTGSVILAGDGRIGEGARFFVFGAVLTWGESRHLEAEVWDGDVPAALGSG